MLSNLQRYNQELELQNQIKSELMDSNQLLNRMLPLNALNLLKRGTRMIAEEFNEVTILFTDIVGK